MRDQLDVYGIGQCCIDCLARIPAYPPPDTKCEVLDLVIDGGGPVATAVVALARWGVRCAFSGVVGDDQLAEDIRRLFDREGVDTADLLVRIGAESQLAFIVAEPGSGRRTVFWRRPTGEPPSPDEVALDRIRSARVLLTDGLFPAASLAAASAARDADIPVVVDAGSLRDGMLDLATTSDHFLASESFARAWAPGTAPLEVCHRLAELGPSVAAVTLGERGWVAVAGGRELVGAAHRVDALDATGCGDVFHAGYTYGLLEGWSVARRLDFGAWAAASVALRLGGRAGIPTVSDYPGAARDPR
jgi:ribokinase